MKYLGKYWNTLRNVFIIILLLSFEVNTAKARLKQAAVNIAKPSKLRCRINQKQKRNMKNIVSKHH